MCSCDVEERKEEFALHIMFWNCLLLLSKYENQKIKVQDGSSQSLFVSV